HDMRISEDFHFDFNSDETREKVNGARTHELITHTKANYINASGELG
ncbi:hypothetical protein SARC_16025, partial [Sphaeroforma arctica JP610]